MHFAVLLNQLISMKHWITSDILFTTTVERCYGEQPASKSMIHAHLTSFYRSSTNKNLFFFKRCRLAWTDYPRFDVSSHPKQYDSVPTVCSKQGLLVVSTAQIMLPVSAWIKSESAACTACTCSFNGEALFCGVLKDSEPTIVLCLQKQLSNKAKRRFNGPHFLIHVEKLLYGFKSKYVFFRKVLLKIICRT